MREGSERYRFLRRLRGHGTDPSGLNAPYDCVILPLTESINAVSFITAWDDRPQCVPSPQQGRKVFTLQMLPACDEPFDDGVGKVAGFHSARPRA
jgi:hypothetical protein